MLDEMAVEFLRSPTRETKELPIGIAQIMNLPSSLDTVTNIERSEPMRSSASIEIVPQKSMTTEETLISEKECDTLLLDSSKLSTVPKYNLIGLNESVQVSEVHTEELPQETHESKPTAQLAKTELIPTQSLQVSESMTHDSASELQPFSSVPSSAKVELYTHDAKIVQETISNQSEENLTLPQAPIASKAHAQVLSKESVEITEVNRIEKEETFDGHIKLPSVVPKYQFLPSESIQTSETVAEDSPSKFYPELAVPTETARKVFVEQKSYTTHVLNAPEKEDVYVPGRLPPQQKADILLYTTEPLQIAEQPTQEHETEFSAALKPTTCTAVDTLATHESLTTETINENYCTKPFESDTFETKTATVDFRERTTVSVSNIISNETESELAPFEQASSARALPSLSTLSIGQSELPFVHEKETQHLGVPRPNEATAEFSLEPIENLAVTEIETADAAGRFSPEAQERTETASTAYVLQQSHVVSAVQANEKEYEFEGKTDQKPAFAETQLDVQHQLEVISHQISERETLFQAPQMPSDHVAKSTPTDMLKTVLIEETLTNLSAAEFANPIQDISAAQIKTDELEEKVISETTVYEGLQNYEKPAIPEQKVADTLLQPNTELVVTEIVTEQREHEGYDVHEIAKDYTAQTVPTHSLKSVLVEETMVSDSLDQVNEPQQMHSLATVKDDKLEETIVSETLVLEGTQLYVSPDIPAAKSVDSSIEPREGLLVTEIVPEVKEQEGIKQMEAAKDYVVRPTATDALKSVLIEEIQVSNITAELVKPDVPTSAATVHSDELEQTTVSEALILEGVNRLPEDAKPQEKTAETLITPNTELTIIEVVAEQKEREGFDVQEIAKDYVAQQVPAHTLKSVIIETTEANDSTADISKLQMNESSAVIKTDQFEEKIISETIIYEDIKKQEPHDYDTRQAERTLSPISELIVTEVVTEQREKEGLDVQQVATDHVIKAVPTHSLKSILVQETLASDSVEDVVSETPLTNLATVRNDQFEQTTVSETVVYEGTELVPEDQKPTERTADKILPLVNELIVTEIAPEEKENEGFSAADLAKDHVAKSVPTDTLKSLTIEEVLATESSEKFEQVENITTTASVKSDQHEQTTVSETMILEDTAQYEAAPKPDAKLAERVVSPIDELIVTEVNPEQKEREGYDVAELARENVAQAVPSHTLKTVVVEEVQPSDSFVKLEKCKDDKTSAVVKSDEFEQTTISETIVYEASQQLVDSEKPASKNALPAYLPNTEIVVTEVVAEQKEKEGYSVEDVAKDHVAKTVPSHTLKSVQVQETLSSENVEKFNEEAATTSSAICKDDTFEETQVRELVVLESVAKYDKEEKPDEKTAEPIVTPISELVVTEVVAEQREREGYSVEEIAKDHTAKIVSDTMKSITVEEVMLADVLGKVLETQSDTKLATIRKDEMEETTTSETYIFEGIRHYVQEKPSEKVAAPNVEAISELVVTEVITEQKESEGYDVKEIASNYVAKEVPSHMLRSVQVEQVQPSDDVQDIPVQESQSLHAKPISSEIEQKIISETTVLENIDTMADQLKPERKSAEATFQPNIELVVTEVITEQREKEGYSVEDIASQHVAKAVPSHSLKSIIVEEVVTSNTTEDVTVAEDGSTAHITEGEFEQTTVTQQLILENLGQLEKQVQPEEKEAVPSLLPNQELVITEVVSEQKETEGYSVDEISKNYSAKQVPSHTLKSITVEEVQLADATENIEQQETVTSLAAIRKNEFEQTTVSETLIYEGLGHQPEGIAPEQKTADVTLQPNTELIVTEIVTEQKEKDGYDVQEIAKDYAAKPVTEGLMRSLIVEEVQPSDQLGKVEQSTLEQSATAKKDQYEQTIETETIVYEGIEGIQDAVHPDKKTADVLVQPNAELVVTQVISEQREKEGFSVDEIARNFVAQVAPAKTLKSVVIEEVEVTEDVSHMDIQERAQHSALSSKDTFEQTTITETLTYEDVTDQNLQQSPEQRIAEASLEPISEVTVTEVTTEQKAEDGINITEAEAHTAKLVPTQALKSLNVEQVQPVHETSEVTIESSKTSTATVTTDELSVTSVSETTAYEGIKEYTDKNNLEFFTAKLIPADVFKSLTIEQIQPFLNTGNVPEEVTKPQSVSVRTDEQEQVVASETTVFECLKDFIDKLEQEEHSAKLITGDILKSLTIEQVMLLHQTGEAEQFIATTTSALMKTDEREETTVTEAVIYEALKEHLGTFVPEGQTAKEIPCDALKSLNVQQIQPLDELSYVTPDKQTVSLATLKTDEQEQVVTSEATVYEALKDYDETLTIEQHLAKRVLPYEQKPLSVQQTETFIGIGDVQADVYKTSEADIITDEFEQKTISEVSVYEGIFEGTKIVEIDEKHASPAFDGLKLPTKSVVGTSDAIEELLSKPTVQAETAIGAFIEQNIVSRTETVVHDSLGRLKDQDEVDTKHAIPQVSDFHVPTLLETIPNEALNQIETPEAVVERNATVAFSDFIAPLQSHIISADTTAPFEEIIEPRKFATKSIQDGLRAAECIEVSSNELNDINVPTEAPHGQASVSFTTNIIANVTETRTHENVDNIIVTKEPTERFAKLTQSMFDMYEELTPIVREGKFYKCPISTLKIHAIKTFQTQSKQQSNSNKIKTYITFHTILLYR